MPEAAALPVWPNKAAARRLRAPEKYSGRFGFIVNDDDRSKA
jgi:hypothetical protein